MVKQLDAHDRIALTGTPVENRLGDLWSIFDFINPGLLGSGKDFTKFAKRLGERSHDPYAPLRELVRPYILPRLKTDKTVISDLPGKTEVKAFCQLTQKQAALYQESVKELAERLEKTDEGIERKGMILSFLMRFKQICNHPSQWLGDGEWSERDSGKLARLREIVEVIEARQEKVLVFTQFREITAPLAAFLQSLSGRPGLVLHGETEVKKRQSLVRQFQEDESIPFFVLSLKAGGSGLNLTAASHVIHFDRWWNPAVENQATDRALVELLEGRFSKQTMERLCQQKTGMFPQPAEIKFTCSCPDSARMCKHVAAVLYGIGARLDEKPEVLFTLRNVDQRDLITKVGTRIAKPKAAKLLRSDNLSELFGIDIAETEANPRGRTLQRGSVKPDCSPDASASGPVNRRWTGGPRVRS